MRCSQLVRYWNTVRHLKPVQVYGRVLFTVNRPRPDLRDAPPPRVRMGTWIPGPAKERSMFGPAQFRFLNEEHTLSNASGWNDPAREKLWLYNLHYFDDLNAEGAESRRSLHLGVMQRWISENPPGKGNGWEPYPTSLRIVNWVKWAFRQQRGFPVDLVNSLAVQSRFLYNRLEYHLLGNHLLANAKALVFAGFFFAGPEADNWLEAGCRILTRQLAEQILPDGGHFERSPMYHAIVLEDLLDIVNLLRVYRRHISPEWSALGPECRKTAGRMLYWLKAMSHPDGEISLFNDAAFGIAAPPALLADYASQLGVLHSTPNSPLVHLRDTGYVRVLKGPAAAFLDVAPIGPDYLPGHAHADTLSFELSLFDQRTIVDSGTSCYGTGPERQCQRSTPAHNTVEIDGTDSSETWGGFRVARRAHPFGLEVREEDDRAEVSCSHTGYRRRLHGAVHCRHWTISEKELSVRDVITGQFNEAVGRFHFHPEVRLEAIDSHHGTVTLPLGQVVHWEVTGGTAAVGDSTYHPEFGLNIPNRVLEVKLEGQESTALFRWS